MFSKIDIREIIKDHIRTFHDYRLKNRQKRKTSASEIIFFFLIPFLLGAGLTEILPISEQLNAILITVYTVLIGLFLSIMMLLFSSLSIIRDTRTTLAENKSRNEGNVDDAEWHLLLVKELFTNLSFSVFLSLATLVLLFTLNVSFSDGAICFRIFKYLLLVMTWSAIVAQFFVVLMILKRTHTLFDYEYQQVKNIRVDITPSAITKDEVK